MLETELKSNIKTEGSPSDLSERAHEVAPAPERGSRATLQSRSRFRRHGAQKLARSDVLERHLEVAPAPERGLRATLQSRSPPYRSDQSGAIPPSHYDLPIRATLPERQGRVARVLITRRRENESGATSRSDTARSLPKHGATTRSDERRSLAF
ncbi:hypothetical protein YC2023_078333 [Brassica napus]